MSALRALVRLWDRLWFAPVDARAVGAFRVALGLTALVSFVCMTPEMATYYGPDPALVRAAGAHPVWQASLYSWIPEPSWVPAVHLLAALPLVAFTVGFGGRVGHLLALVVLLSLHHGAPSVLNSGDRLIRQLMLVLLTVPSSRAVSVDAWRARRRGQPLPGTVPVVAHRLVQAQVCWMYLHTALLKAEGTTWWNGSAVYYALSADPLVRFPELLDGVLLGWPPFVYGTAVLTWVTLAWEAGFVVLVLWRPTRILALLIGLLLHLGIAVFLMIAPFSFATLACYLLFVDPSRVGRWVDAAAAAVGRGSSAPGLSPRQA